jgi:hypothetical protein
MLEKKYNFKRLYKSDTWNGDFEESLLSRLVHNKKVTSEELGDTFFNDIIQNYLKQTKQKLNKGENHA